MTTGRGEFELHEVLITNLNFTQNTYKCLTTLELLPPSNSAGYMDYADGISSLRRKNLDLLTHDTDSNPVGGFSFSCFAGRDRKSQLRLVYKLDIFWRE